MTLAGQRTPVVGLLPLLVRGVFFIIRCAAGQDDSSLSPFESLTGRPESATIRSAHLTCPAASTSTWPVKAGSSLMCFSRVLPSFTVYIDAAADLLGVAVSAAVAASGRARQAAVRVFLTCSTHHCRSVCSAIAPPLLRQHTLRRPQQGLASPSRSWRARTIFARWPSVVTRLPSQV